MDSESVERKETGRHRTSKGTGVEATGVLGERRSPLRPPSEVITTTEGHDGRTSKKEAKCQINLSRNCRGFNGTLCCYCRIKDYHRHHVTIILYVSQTLLF